MVWALQMHSLVQLPFGRLNEDFFIEIQITEIKFTGITGIPVCPKKFTVPIIIFIYINFVFRYQENPTYGKSSEIEVQMSSLRHELRLLEMKQSGFSCQVYFNREPLSSGTSLIKFYLR